MGRRKGSRPLTDEPERLVDRYLVLVAEGGNGEIYRRQAAILAGGRALLYLTGHRASRSFLAILAALSFQSSGMRPSRIAAFCVIVLRCLGSATIVDATIVAAHSP
jgi:hypothetical protein